MADDDISTTCYLNYESKTHVVDERKNSGVVFSVRFRIVERSLVRSPNGRETLAQQRTLEQSNGTIVFRTPPAFLAGEETCSTYVADMLSQAEVPRWIQQRIVPRICKDMMINTTGIEEGFLVEAEVEVVEETSFNNYISLDEYEGRLVPIEQDCVICLEELLLGGERKIMKLLCSHNFHRDCLLTWLRRNHSCPTCRDDIQNPRPKK